MAGFAAMATGKAKIGRAKTPRRRRPPASQDPSKGRGTRGPDSPTVPASKSPRDYSGKVASYKDKAKSMKAKGRARPYPKNPVKRKKAVDYVIDRQAKKGNTLTRAQARKRVRANIKADKRGAAYKYDFAGDGAGTKDKDFGSKANNQRRKRAGYKFRNKAGADAYGTGRAFGTGKPKKDKPKDPPKQDTSDDPGNSQSGDSYGGPQSAGRQLSREEKKKKKNKRKNRHGNG